MPWPWRVTYSNDSSAVLIDPSNFRVDLVGEDVANCSLLQRAVRRYERRRLFFDDVAPASAEQLLDAKPTLTSLRVASAEFVCESVPHERMDESYELSIESDEAELTARSSWGVLRGLETFAQLVYAHGRGTHLYAVRAAHYADKPRFSHRGFMLDTARHYVPVHTIERMLDAMSYNKLNVFHWHIVDDQSFPFVSRTYPQLSQANAYRPHMVYTHADIRRVRAHAEQRGIRVMIELDTPGHSYAMRQLPNLLTRCYNTTTREPNGQLGPIDPSEPQAYAHVRALLRELTGLFGERMFHAGGDEVDHECWRSNPHVNAFMHAHNISAGNYSALSNFYMARVGQMLAQMNKTMLVWQEVFDDGANLPRNQTIVHVWKYINDKPAYMLKMREVLKAGYRALLSSCWYLNYIDYGQDWDKFYQCDPAGEPIEPHLAELVLGGEICMWTEFVDETNVESRTWPRASAAAERLWSPQDKRNSQEFAHRLEQIRCRLVYRGIKAEPVNGPGYC